MMPKKDQEMRGAREVQKYVNATGRVKQGFTKINKQDRRQQEGNEQTGGSPCSHSLHYSKTRAVSSGGKQHIYPCSKTSSFVGS